VCLPPYDRDNMLQPGVSRARPFRLLALCLKKRLGLKQSLCKAKDTSRRTSHHIRPHLKHLQLPLAKPRRTCTYHILTISSFSLQIPRSGHNSQRTTTADSIVKPPSALSLLGSPPTPRSRRIATDLRSGSYEKPPTASSCGLGVSCPSQRNRGKQQVSLR
jgi:hypothetical protein